MNGHNKSSIFSAPDHVSLALSIANVGLWDWDLENNTVIFSKEWKQQLGYSENEINDDYEEWKSRLHPDDKTHVLQYIREYLAHPHNAYHVEMRLRHKDGTYRWILAQGALVAVDDGHRKHLLGSHIDITETKKRCRH